MKLLKLLCGNVSGAPQAVLLAEYADVRERHVHAVDLVDDVADLGVVQQEVHNDGVLHHHRTGQRVERFDPQLLGKVPHDLIGEVVAVGVVEIPGDLEDDRGGHRNLLQVFRQLQQRIAPCDPDFVPVPQEALEKGRGLPHGIGQRPFVVRVGRFGHQHMLEPEPRPDTLLQLVHVAAGRRADLDIHDPVLARLGEQAGHLRARQPHFGRNLGLVQVVQIVEPRDGIEQLPISVHRLPPTVDSHYFASFSFSRIEKNDCFVNRFGLNFKFSFYFSRIVSIILCFIRFSGNNRVRFF